MSYSDPKSVVPWRFDSAQRDRHGERSRTIRLVTTQVGYLLVRSDRFLGTFSLYY